MVGNCVYVVPRQISGPCCMWQQHRRVCSSTKSSSNNSSAQLLVSGKWPQLQHLNISGIKLHPAGMAMLQSGNWPLVKSLIMSRCDVRSSSFMHLTATSWQSLECVDCVQDPGRPNFASDKRDGAIMIDACKRILVMFACSANW